MQTYKQVNEIWTAFYVLSRGVWRVECYAKKIDGCHCGPICEESVPSVVLHYFEDVRRRLRKRVSAGQTECGHTHFFTVLRPVPA